MKIKKENYIFNTKNCKILKEEVNIQKNNLEIENVYMENKK